MHVYPWSIHTCTVAHTHRNSIAVIFRCWYMYQSQAWIGGTVLIILIMTAASNRTCNVSGLQSLLYMNYIVRSIQEPSIKYVMLFLTSFSPSLCHKSWKSPKYNTFWN